MKNSLLLRRGKLLEYGTLSWNTIGVFVLAAAAKNSGSVALVAFGFDTLLEIGASTIVIWELNGTSGKRQKHGLRLLGILFFLLGLYIILQALVNLVYHFHATQSSLGMIWLLLTFIAMSILAFFKHRIGKQLNNLVLITEGRVTLVDAILAAIVLISMALAKWLRWNWTDIVAGLILMVYCFLEAKHAWRGSDVLATD